MIFSYANRTEIDEQYIHDSVFVGYVYNYDKRQITISCIDEFRQRRNILTFNNVIFSEMESCEFWHPSNRFYDIWIEDNSSQMKSLLNILNSDKEKYEMNQLTKGIEYVEIKMQLISGDTLFIICESLDWIVERII